MSTQHDSPIESTNPSPRREASPASSPPARDNGNPGVFLSCAEGDAASASAAVRHALERLRQPREPGGASWLDMLAGCAGVSAAEQEAYIAGRLSRHDEADVRSRLRQNPMAFDAVEKRRRDRMNSRPE